METRSGRPTASPDGSGGQMGPDSLETLAEKTVYSAEMIHNYKVSPSQEEIAHYSHAERTLEVIGPDGNAQTFEDLLIGEYYWGPDGDTIAFTTMDQVRPGLYRDAEVRTLSPGGGMQTVYSLEEGYIHGIEWSPHGDSIYVVELIDEPERQVGYLKRVTLSGSVTTLVQAEGMINFFAIPTTWYEYGQGSSDRDYKVTYGIDDGVFICDRDGSNTVRIINYPGDGVDNIEWSPDGTRLALNFRYPVTGAEGQQLQGLFLVIFRDGSPTYYPLYEQTDVHTLWWGPNGDWLTYGNRDTLFLYNQRTGERREVQIRPEADVPEGTDPEEVEEPDPLQLRGFYFDDSGEQMVVSASNRAYIYFPNVEVPEGEDAEDVRGPHFVHEHGDPDVHFIAEPHFLGDEIVFTVFEDMEAERRRQSGEESGD